jgi:hypothetical protein
MFKSIPNHREYEINIEGVVRKISSGKIIQMSKHGYVTLLSKDALNVYGEVYDKPYYYRINVRRMVCKVFNKPYNANRGENHPKFKGYYIVSGQTYSSSYEAAKATGIGARTIYRKCMKGMEHYEFHAK